MRHNYNGNSFTVYDDELSMLEIVDEHHKAIVNKTDLYGDHKGSWQGLNRPTLSEEGMRATVEKLNNSVNFISIDNIGGKVNDNTFDNGIIIQKAVDEMYLKGGGIVQIPQGKWYVKTTINLRSGVTLKGSGVGKPDSSDSGTSLVLNGNNTLIRAIKNDEDVYYKWSIGLKNIGLYCSEIIPNSTAIELSECSYTRIENVHIAYFDVGMKINGGMLDTYRDMAIFACTQYGVKYENILPTTSQTWENVYIGQMTSGIPLYLSKNSCIDLTLNRPTFESSPCAIVSDDTNCVFTVNDIYVENIPRTINGVTQGTIFTIGGDNDAWKSTFTLRNGIVLGNNTTAWTNTNLFDVRQINTLLVDGVSWNRVGKIFTETSFDKIRTKPIFRNCNSEHGLVTVDLDSSLYKDKIIVDNCCVKSLPYGTTKIIPTVYGNKWTDFGEGYGGIVVKVNEIDRIVSINGSAKINEGALNDDNKIIILPNEYKCPSQMFFSGTCSKSGAWIPATFRITSTGQIELFDGLGGVAGVGFSLTYSY